MKMLLSFLAGLVALPALALAILASGSVDFAATHPAGPLEARLAKWALRQSRAAHTSSAPALATPPATPEAHSQGLDHYRENCLVCHSAPGLEPSEIARGLNPPAPELWSAGSERQSDAVLSSIISRGIRWSGMPAFGPTHTPEEIGHLIVFVRHLPALSAEERAALKPAEEEEHHHAAAPGPTPH